MIEYPKKKGKHSGADRKQQIRRRENHELSSRYHIRISKVRLLLRRARRSEYWYFALLNWAVSAVLTAFTRYTDSSFPSLLLSLWNIGVLLPGLGVCWRRLHDTGRSGAWFFLNLIPVVGQIVLLIWLCGDSQPGWNRYGDSPKYPSGGYGGGYGQGGYGRDPYGQGKYDRSTYQQNSYGQNNGGCDWKP